MCHEIAIDGVLGSLADGREEGVTKAGQTSSCRSSESRQPASWPGGSIQVLRLHFLIDAGELKQTPPRLARQVVEYIGCHAVGN